MFSRRCARLTAAFALLAAVALVLPGCAHRLTRRLVEPRSASTLDHASPWLKVHGQDGTLFVLAEWTVDETARTVRGRGQRLDPDRVPVASGDLTVPLDSVALFETNVVSPHPAVAGLTLLTGVSVALTAYCLANPKACFGSCPTFYAEEAGGPRLVAEGFSASVAPCFEATDLDALARVRSPGRRFALTMRNEALETHVVRHADLLAVPCPPGASVFADAGGEFRQAEETVAPVRAEAAEGDCAALLAALDDRERTSLADSTDLAARETIDLTFPARPAGEYGLVVGMRQSLLSTYLFYETLAALGRNVGDWYARLGRADPATRQRATSFARALGGIEVLVPAADGWRSAGEVLETGPLATDVRLVPLPGAGGSPQRVRLVLTRGAWRIDWVALARLGRRVEPVRLSPVRVVRQGAGDVVDEDARAALLDPARALVTQPGDAYRLEYDLPERPERCALFLESRGYYLEWMRAEWQKDENPARAALLFLDPRRALREMAPAFKRAEDGMEAAFWGSRFARP